MVDKNRWNHHMEICQEALKYLDEHDKICLVCDEDKFDTITEVFKHIKIEHLDIIFLMEKRSENTHAQAQPFVIKTEVEDPKAPLGSEDKTMDNIEESMESQDPAYSEKAQDHNQTPTNEPGVMNDQVTS